MTAQAPEILIFRDKKLALFDQPLYSYLKRLPKARRPIFRYGSSACWRGYVGTWEIRQGLLTLVSLEGNLQQGDDIVDATLELAFPKAKGGLAATWFTGHLRCVEGLCLQYVHRGYSSQYERDRVLEFDKGRLVSEFVSLNPPPPLYYEIHEDGTRTCRDAMHRGGSEIEDPLEGKPFESVYEMIWSKKPEGEEYFGPLALTTFGEQLENP